MVPEDPAVSHSILIIDDEDDIREVAALSLETVAGWRVFMANSGSQGLARAIEHQPEAILLDVMMPGMDGPTTFRELRGPAPCRAGGRRCQERRTVCGLPIGPLAAVQRRTGRRRKPGRRR
jgi:CheY-like chemotaxis protein